jgi:hypothetical protein
MPITVTCSCGRASTFRDEFAGQTRHCLFCEAPLRLGGGPVPDVEFVETPRPRAAPPAPPAAENVPNPWEHPHRTFLSRWWGTWSQATFRAGDFFERIPYAGGYGRPLGYVLGLAGQVLVPLGVLATMTGIFVLLGMNRSTPDVFQVAILPILVGVGLVLLAAAAYAFVWAAVHHLFAKLVGGRGPFEATFRAVCYTSGIHLWQLLPALVVAAATDGHLTSLMTRFFIAGSLALFSPAHQVAALSVALAKAHQFRSGRAAIAALLPTLMLLGTALVGAVAWLWLGMGLRRGYYDYYPY